PPVLPVAASRGGCTSPPGGACVPATRARRTGLGNTSGSIGSNAIACACPEVTTWVRTPAGSTYGSGSFRTRRTVFVNGPDSHRHHTSTVVGSSSAAYANHDRALASAAAWIVSTWVPVNVTRIGCTRSPA